MGKKKGKKTQPAAGTEPEAGSSRGAAGGQGDAGGAAGGAGSAQQVQQTAGLTQGDGARGTQQQSAQGKGGKGKGPPQGKEQTHPKDQPPQRAAEGSTTQQPRGGPAQQEHMGRGGPPQQQQMGRGGPGQQQHVGRGGPPQQQQMGRGEPAQQQHVGRGGPPQQQQMGRGGPPQQQHVGRGGPPQQQQMGRGGPPQQQHVGRGGPPQQQQMGRGGPPQQQHVGRGGPAQQQQPPAPGPWGRQQPAGPPPQQQQQQQQQQPPTQAPRGQQTARGPTTQPQGPQGQQTARGPTTQPQGPQAQKQQPARGAQPTQGRPSSQTPSVSSIQSSLSQVHIRKDEGDADIVSKTMHKPGKQGRIIKVESNHLQLNLGQIRTAYHYDVNIVPDTPKKMMRPVIESLRRQFFPTRWPAFDGKKNLYTASPLTNNMSDVINKQITITEEDGREKKFEVQIKFANEVDMTPLKNLLNSPTTPQEALQVVDIVLRMAPVATCFPVGRSFFVKPTDGIIDLGEGMEMYHGFYQSAIRGWKPLLNVDVAHKAFPQNINVVDALVQLITTYRQPMRREDLRSLDRFQEETLLKYIRGLRVTYEITGHPGSRKNYRVNGLGASAARATFESNGQKITIQEYFARTKNFRLRYTDLPTLWVGNPQRPDKILLPLELCIIMEGQAIPRKMTEQQTSKMIKQAATDTSTRKRKIMQGLQRSNYNQNNSVREFGFSVGNEFQKLDARVLTPPELQYANRTARVSRGVWRNELFLTPVTINRWTFVSACRYPPRPDEYKKMIEFFEKSAREVGMTFTSKPVEPFGTITGRQTYSDVESYFKAQKNKFDVIFVVVPDSGPQYSFVKKAAEVVVGSLTQCIKSTTVARRMNSQTALNLLLKVNSKLNGINHTFTANTKPAILKRPVMIMGADVTHPGPDARDIPSVAAVTASHDPKAFQYNITWRLQNPKEEIIEDLEAIVIEHLKFFYTKTKVKPEAIVFFRDGVSEGQFAQVKNAEIRAIRAACKKVQTEGYEPKITFLVVQKRHHTRLFPMNPRDSEDKNCNVPAGTCVDTEITHPFLQDFYLVSHASIQGVAKPTKYVTLWDDNDMDNDQVEQLAYYLCHMFSRCNRSVSYPAPTYYAHLAAARAKVYIENDQLNMDRLRDEFNKYQIRDEIRKQLPMFFV